MPDYGALQLVQDDDTPQLGIKDVRLLQSIIDTFLWYCRVLDLTGLVSLGQLSSTAAHPTEQTMTQPPSSCNTSPPTHMRQSRIAPPA